MNNSIKGNNPGADLVWSDLPDVAQLLLDLTNGLEVSSTVESITIINDQVNNLGPKFRMWAELLSVLYSYPLYKSKRIK